MFGGSGVEERPALDVLGCVSLFVESYGEVEMKAGHKLGAAVGVALIAVFGAKMFGDSIYMTAAPDEVPYTEWFPILQVHPRGASEAVAVELRPGDPAWGRKQLGGMRCVP